MNIQQGLCNGTRMLIKEMRPNLVVCKILEGDHAVELAYIPRFTLCCDEEYPFSLQRHQFPFVLAFAMTNNKVQGQTLETIGIDLRKNVFSYGQLYTAFSRIRTLNSLLIRLDKSNVDRKVKNKVFKEVLDDYN
jgi:ATP-dependent DNA helicase PIF1